MHGRSSLSEEQREAAVALFETGWGAWAVATRLGVGRGAVKRLSMADARRYDAGGEANTTGVLV